MKFGSGKMNNVKRSISIKLIGALIVFTAIGLVGGAWEYS